MSEVQSRPATSRGRGSGRGGRGGHSIRGGAGRAPNRTTTTNGDSKHDQESALPSLEDEGEVGQLKKLYGSKVPLIKEMFADWSDVDILFALRETDGDENLTVTRMAEGTIAQWGEVSKTKKERARPKAKNDTFTTTTADSVPSAHPRSARGGRPGAEGGRGGRGRATERGGRGGVRGKSAVAPTNGTRTKDTSGLSIPTEESSEWDAPKPSEDTAAWGDETSAPAPAPTTEPTPTAPAPTAAPAAAPKADGPKTWASMLRQATVPKPAPKPKETPVPKPSEPVIEPLPPAGELVEPEPESPVEEEVEEEEPTPETVEEPIAPAPAPVPAPVAIPNIVVPEVAIIPSKDQLTETNLEQIVDDSHPPETETAASEAADSWDPRAQGTSATATPISASQQQHQARAPASGFAATATKATDRASTRTPSFQRRVLDQREAVRMPGNRDQVDRAAVQFGAFSLNGPIDEDIDGDREEPETRPQPPEDSPVIHPRTSLPPAQPAPVPEAYAPQKPAASLPPTGPAATTPLAAAAPPSAPSQPSAVSQGAFASTAPAWELADSSLIGVETAAQPPAAQNSQQYGRFGQPVPQEPASFASKPFDSYAQQQASVAAAHSSYEAGFQSQVPAAQPQAQQHPGAAFSSAPSEFSHYAVDPQNRNAYQNYYAQGFAQQQGAQGQQEGLPAQPQRSFSGYNAPQNDNLSQYPQSGAQHAQSRFGSGSTAEAQISGTPTPAQAASQAQTAQSAQGQSHAQQQQHAGDYPYNHPYYNNPYYSSYMNNGYGGYNQGAYGAPYGKGGLGYQPNQYGMTPQGPHAGYASSPAAAFGQSTLHRDSAVAAGTLGDYGRAGSGQSGQGQVIGATGFGGMHDSFGRGASGYQSQAGQSFVPGSQPGSVPTAADDLKPFGDAKVAGGPSPSLGAAARPGSAANNAPSQAGLPLPQSNQQSGLAGMGGYGYPNHVQGHGVHAGQTGAGGYGMSASGGQGHQNSYGGYGGQGFGGSYYGGNPPRGWGNNYH
ncbi:hypothetical protein B0T17DRAFT_613321 [Bombardia bombarda]|uniref:RNA polymerase II degradation factor 1 n=1 Tax=Bombardia bombarda TaxID=252184 RepID=A0AA39XNN7_9PEZI|nr:hypothetical protein B0T17DRAFT_613321 [Bombardia bombarda]